MKKLLLSERIEKVNPDEVKIPLSTDDLVALSQAIAFCERHQFKQMKELCQTRALVTTALYTLLVWIDEDNTSQ